MEIMLRKSNDENNYWIRYRKNISVIFSSVIDKIITSLSKKNNCNMTSKALFHNPSLMQKTAL